MGSSDVSQILLATFGNSLKPIINHFLQLPWFGRRWVLQELALSCDVVVHCHVKKLSWLWIASGLKIWQSVMPYDSTEILIRRALETICTLESNNGNILDVLWNFDIAMATKPSDMLFAVYGLAENIYFENSGTGICKVAKETPWGPHYTIQAFVDYGIKFQEVYSRFAAACVEANYW
jgi:hypothetical protein